MKLNTPKIYHLDLFDDRPCRLVSNGSACEFSKPASTKKHPKLYTLSAAGKLFYVESRRSRCLHVFVWFPLLDTPYRHTVLGIAQVVMLGELAVNKALDNLELPV